MENIWYRNPSKSEVIGRKKPNDHTEPTKVERLKKKIWRSIKSDFKCLILWCELKLKADLNLQNTVVLWLYEFISSANILTYSKHTSCKF